MHMRSMRRITSSCSRMVKRYGEAISTIKSANIMAKEEKPKEKPHEVTIEGRDIITVYPKLEEKHLQAIVTYRADELPTSHVTIDLYDLFKQKQEEASKQIRIRKGDLWEKYRKVEKELIHKHIHARLLEKPERITL